MSDELRAEYDFDYGKAKPNRFAEIKIIDDQFVPSDDYEKKVAVVILGRVDLTCGEW